jgi:hypothetical protein
MTDETNWHSGDGMADAHRIEEGAWQKAVAPPPPGSRPTGLPQASALPPRPTPPPTAQSSGEHGASTT